LTTEGHKHSDVHVAYKRTALPPEGKPALTDVFVVGNTEQNTLLRLVASALTNLAREPILTPSPQGGAYKKQKDQM
jgi:hypothetical protein